MPEISGSAFEATSDRLAISAKGVLESVAFKTALANLDAAIVSAWRATESTNVDGLQKCRDLMDIKDIFTANLIRFVSNADAAVKEGEEAKAIIW